MRDPKRIDEFCCRFAELWYQYPNMRFGQLVCCTLGFDPFYIEDDAALQQIEEKVKEWQPH